MVFSHNGTLTMKWKNYWYVQHEPKKYHTEWKKPYTEDYITYDSTHMKS